MMSRLTLWISGLLLVVVLLAPSLAGAKDDGKNAADAKPATANDAAPAAMPASPNWSADRNSNLTALLGLLVMKGVLAPGEANAIRNAAPDAEFQLLLEALARKGVVSAADVAAIAPASPNAPTPAPTTATAVPSSAHTSAAAPAPMTATASTPTATTAASPETKPAAPSVVAAVAPLRVLPLDPPLKDGLIPGFKVGAVKVTPYGFIKATVVHDTSDPNGDDFPFPGIFLNSSTPFNTGPTSDPSFHIKARSSRFGANFEWPDIAPKLTLTGKVEGDFEGNFSEVDNADVSSIRNPSPRLRLAYVRLDYAATDKSDVFFEGGQDWSLFGSTALPNILETTFLGAFSGDIWERTPQFRFGLVQKLGGPRNFKFSPEIALMMPSTGEIYRLSSVNGLGGFEAQIGEGERQGADSGRPELEARTVLQFQLDKAPGVAPAQLIWSGYEARRTAITTSGDLAASSVPADLLQQYPSGFTNSSNLFGDQFAVQLPTRWVTLVASAWRGGDMRFMLGGQLNTYFTDTSGLYDVQTVQTVDNVNVATGAQMIGCTVAITAGSCTASHGSWEIARQRPIGAFGGFLNLGLPLSRWFNANPKGHNAGWQLYLHAGKDQVAHNDIKHALGFGCASADGLTPCNGALPLMQSRMLAATVYYKLNQWATFSFEQSQYQTTLAPEVGPLYTIAGQPATKWKDQRTEFGPIFSF
jgi:hypothetical protein